MPSSPRKRSAKTRAKPQEVVRDDDDDSTDSSMPPLVDSSDEESKESRKQPRKAVSNADSVKMWLDLSKASRDRHIRVIKIYLLSPFLFDIVEQEDKWINWAHECHLLPTKRDIDLSLQIQDCMESVDVVEDAFSNVRKYLLAKDDSDETEKALGMMDKINSLEKLDKAIMCAESFTTFLKIRENIKTAHFTRKGDGKRKGDTSLLLALQQVYDHIRKLTRENIDLTKQFEEMCRQVELQSTDMRKKGNTHFIAGKYKAAISAYSKAILFSQYSYILYGNRAQSYLRTNETWLALIDGRRSVVLKPDWTKGQYRYAQAYFQLGDTDRALNTNREAKMVCSKDSKDLDIQHEKFLSEKKRDIQAKKNAGKHKDKTKIDDINNIPELVDPDSCDTCEDSDDDNDDVGSSSCSDDNMSDTESIPGLVTDSSRDSDSDDDVPRRKNQDTQTWNSVTSKPLIKQINGAEQQETKRRKKREKDKNKPDQAKRKEVDANEGPQKRKDLAFTLKQGSKAYLDGKVKASVRFYGEAFEMLSLENAFEIFKIKSIDFILILYAHGTACLETGIYKELCEATKQFETILVKYKDIKFPLAFYGLGRVYRRQNKFSEALVPLNQGFNMVKSGEEFGEYRWPGAQTIIEETKPGKLKTVFENILSLCEHPPRPDAICRYNECNIGRTNIYLTDPDYKGYVRLICDESCKIEYHPICWKKYKTTYGEKNADKDYLEDVCMTPDCGIPVVRIQIYGIEGLKTEFVTEMVKVKQKQAKQNKVKFHGNPKQPKVEKHRKEKEEVKAEPENRDVPLNIKDITIPASEEKEIYKAWTADPNPTIKDSRVVDTGVYILRKGEERMQDDMGYMRGAKAKPKKKKVKNVQSLDEFLKDHKGEVAKPAFSTLGEEDEEKPENSTALSGVGPDSPFAVPLHLRSDVQAFEREYRLSLDPKSSFVDPQPPIETPPIETPSFSNSLDPIEDYMYSLFKETLHAHGPLDVGDARMVEPMNFVPDSHQKKIQECGGIKQFLMKSNLFVVQGNVVMLPDELHFQKIVKTVNKYITDKKTSIKTLNDSVGLESSVPDCLDQFWDNDIEESSNPSLRKSPLNPEVREFIPTELSPDESLFDVVPETDLSIGKGTISSEEIDDAGEPSRLDQEDVGTKLSSKNFLKLLSNVAQTRSPCDPRKDKGLKNPKTLGSDGGEMLSKLNVFRVASDDSLTGFKTPTIGTKTTPTPEGCSSHENLMLPKGRARDNLPPLEGGSLENVSGINGENTNGNQIESMATLTTPTKNKRAESSGSETTIGCKTKGVQTQLQMKAKGIMTDAQPEPFRMECSKVTQERDAVQRKLQEASEKLGNIQEKHNLELEKIKKKYTDIQTEKEKLQKELKTSKQEGESKLKKLSESCEEKVKLANSLEQHFKVEQERYQTTITGLQNELTTAKDELTNEKTKFNSSLAQKEELVKKAKLLAQQQEARAQDAEAKLLELRRDVGLRFLERALQEAHVTVTHLFDASKTRNPITLPKLDELIVVWKSYANDCHQKIIQCKTSFNMQIKELKSGRSLLSLPQMPIPGPAPFPAPPILQPLVQNPLPQAQPPPQPQLHPPPQLQLHPPPQLQLHPKPTPDVQMNTVFPGHSAPQTAVVAPQPHTTVPIAAMAPPGVQRRLQQQQHKGHPGPLQNQTVPQAIQQVPQGIPEGASASVAKADAESKSRPSNSFEKIMMRLSITYPFLARAELTSLIKEVRQNKNGTLTGLSLEEIVKSVSQLVEAKIKVGIIRLPVGNQATPSPRSTLTKSRAFQNNLNPPGLGMMNGMAKNSSLQPSLGSFADYNKPCGHFELDDDDPCVICHDDMKTPVDTVTLECGHKYHNMCIRKWLMGEQSTCPTCRVHALLPDEFPRLK